MSIQPDLFTAASARDAALAQVAANAGNWMQRALRLIAYEDGEFIAEELRIRLLRKIEPPHHHNAWGALINTAIRKGLLHKTGRYEQMKTKKSHARATPVLRRTA